MKTKMYEILAVGLMLALGVTVQAQEGRNGGDPNELGTMIGADGKTLDSWAAVKQDLLRGLSLGKHKSIDLMGVNPELFRQKVETALQTAKIVFNNEKVQPINGVSRPCENYVATNGDLLIHCDRDEYAASLKGYTAETQYKMIAHEYFAVAGLEPNTYGVSDYRYSVQISKDLSAVTVMRWAGKSTSFDGAGLLCRIETDGVPFLKKNRTLVIEAAKFGAQFLVSEVTERNLYHKIKDRIQLGPNGTTMQDGHFNVPYKLQPNTARTKEFLSVDENGRMSSELVLPVDGQTLVVSIEYQPGNPFFWGNVISSKGKVLVTDFACIPVVYESEQFELSQGRMSSTYANEKEANGLIKRTVRWLKGL